MRDAIIVAVLSVIAIYALCVHIDSDAYKADARGVLEELEKTHNGTVFMRTPDDADKPHFGELVEELRIPLTKFENKYKTDRFGQSESYATIVFRSGSRNGSAQA